MKTLRYKLTALIPAACLLVLDLGAGAATAAPVTVPNFSFETPVLSPGGVGGGAPTGWTFSAGGGGVYYPTGGDFVSTGPLASPADGNQYAFLETGTANPGTVSLTSAASLTTVEANATYTLTTAIGHRNFDAAGGRRPDDYLIELLVDGSPVASNSLSDAHTNITSGTWVDLGTSFQAPASGGALTIRLTHSSDDATFRQGAFDNIRLDVAAIPEPSTFVLAALGLPGLISYRRRRRNR